MTLVVIRDGRKVSTAQSLHWKNFVRVPAFCWGFNISWIFVVLFSKFISRKRVWADLEFLQSSGKVQLMFFTQGGKYKQTKRARTTLLTLAAAALTRSNFAHKTLQHGRNCKNKLAIQSSLWIEEIIKRNSGGPRAPFLLPRSRIVFLFPLSLLMLVTLPFPSIFRYRFGMESAVRVPLWWEYWRVSE